MKNQLKQTQNHELHRIIFSTNASISLYGVLKTLIRLASIIKKIHDEKSSRDNYNNN